MFHDAQRVADIFFFFSCFLFFVSISFSLLHSSLSHSTTANATKVLLSSTPFVFGTILVRRSQSVLHPLVLQNKHNKFSKCQPFQSHRSRTVRPQISSVMEMRILYFCVHLLRTPTKLLSLLLLYVHSHGILYV